jgi:hypothetical protein
VRKGASLFKRPERTDKNVLAFPASFLMLALIKLFDKHPQGRPSQRATHLASDLTLFFTLVNYFPHAMI